MKIAEIIISLQSLQDQLRKSGVDAATQYDEVCISREAMRLKRDGKTLKIPMIEVSTIG